MRLPFLTLFVTNLVLFFLYPTLVLAIHPQALARREQKYLPPPHVLTSRQHRVARDLLDVCINLNINLLADASQLLGLSSLLGPLDAGSNIQLCLCLKDLDLYLQTNDEVQALVGLLGKNAIATSITALINTSPQARRCAFPPNAHHTCNNADPCHYECDPRYVRQGNACVCAPPYISCNGVCDIFPQGCSSAVPPMLKVHSVAITTLAQAKASCSSQQSVCGIPGLGNTLAFECIDTTAKKDSCGGCMVPHPFFEVEPVRRSSGIDCSTIPHAKSTSCSQSRCVVHACKDGWISSPQAEKCVPLAVRNSAMRQVQKRSSPLSGNATVEASISSDLLSQIIAIVNMVIKLPALAPTSPSPDPATSSSEISGIINEITQCTGNLLKSTTVLSLVESIDALLNTCGLLGSLLADCGCVQVLGISELVQELNQLLLAASSMQSWCKNNPIVPGSPMLADNGRPPSRISSNPNLPEQPVVVGLSSLLSDLGLKSNSGIVVDGLGSGLSSTVNGVLNGLSLGPNNLDITSLNSNVTIDPDLLAQILGLIDLVLNLQRNPDALPPPPALSSGSYLPSTSWATLPTSTAPSHPAHSPSPFINVGLITSIVEATLDILKAPTVSSLVSVVDGFVNVSSLVKGTIGHCGCVDTLGLHSLVASVDAIVNAALAMQSWCHSHPVGVPQPPSSTPAPHSSPATTNSNDDSIIVGLSDLLNGAGLGLLGPVKVGATVHGLDSGLSDDVNGLLTGLGIGPINFKRSDGSLLSVDANATATVNSDLLAQIEDLIGLVVQLDRLFTLPSSSGSPTSTSHPQNSVDPGLVANIVQATADLLQSPTVNSLVTNTDQLIEASTSLANAFASCGCVVYLGLEDAVRYLGLITEAALGLKNWCAANPIVLNPEPPVGSTTSHRFPTTKSSVEGTTLTRTFAPLPSSSTIPSPPLPTDSGATPIVLGLNHLLNGLGLGSIKSVSTIDGLGSGLSSLVNGLLGGLDIGPDGVRRRQLTKRQYSDHVDSQLKTEVYALIDLGLGLSDAGSNLPSSAPPSPFPTATISLPSTPAPSHTPPTIDTNVVVRVVRAIGVMLSSKSVNQLITSVDSLAAASILSLEAVQGCECVAEMGLDQVEGYLIRIVDVTEDIQTWVHGHYVLSPSVKPTAAPALHGAANISDNDTASALTPLLPGLQLLVDGILDLGILSEGGDSGLQGLLVSVVNDLLSPSAVSAGMTRSSAAWKRRS